jgi:hypothetical protein
VRSLLAWGGLFALTGTLGGCAIPFPADGCNHYVVFGFGVVSVADIATKAAVVTDTHVLGMQVSGQPGLKFAVGYASACVTAIPDNATDVRIEASRTPFGAIQIRVQRAALEESSMGGEK